MPVLLATGFRPFGGETRNPSYEAARLLPNRLNGFEVVRAEIPVSYARAWPALRAAIDLCKPDALLLAGQAGGRRAVTPEKCAVNRQGAKAADEDGIVLTDAEIVPGGETRYARADVEGMADAICALGLPGAVSDSAGTYICNALYYAALHHTNLPCVFVHVPYDDTQAKNDVFGMPIADIARALEACARVLTLGQGTKI